MAEFCHPAAAAAADDREDVDLSAESQEPGPLKCCCGSVECIFLRHNYSVLASVEKDVHNAARMGQALLVRHEAYMADAERDRAELAARIEQLEFDNKELEAKNAKTIEDNRNLLDQLEALNNTVIDSESHIRSLEASVLSSQQSVRRLEGETARAAALERQLLALEQEQAELQSHLSSSREEAKSAISRWKRAERGISDLQEQLERMERETQEEREYHVEMISRVERQREMEKELNTAAGRLKGAAAAKSLDRVSGGGSNAVSHFVRDLLQDNANLQYGIAELREMLMNSNDEIQALRDQLMYHQPLGDELANAASTLSAELESEKESPERIPPKTPHELHIHHHFHLPKPKQEMKKPRKKRQGVTPGVFTPPGSTVPSTPPSGPTRPQLGSHTHRDSLLSNCWSTYSDQRSDFALSSVPSTPVSNRRNSLFDHHTIDSFPTSPTTSIDPLSPTWHATHQKQLSNVSSRSFRFSTTSALVQPFVTDTHPIVEESDDGDNPPDLTSATDESTVEDAVSSRDQDATIDDVSAVDESGNNPVPIVRLRRALSHESIISLSGGLDIHTLKSRPSQLTIRHIGSASSVTGSSDVTARPMLLRDSAKRSSTLLRENYSLSPVGSLQSISDSSMLGFGSSKLSKWVGWRPWGGGGGGGDSSSAASSTSAKTVRDNSQKSSGRPPGINQQGAIPGFSEYLAAAQRRVPPPKIRPDDVDRDALREGLGG
ncbi:hypothetical protein F5Y00DRAFT_225503 [Daldinia vernicosa]|uniref:uncharacterized protein n=1 Tax=Daldinia vernicosa TaxID=114800 RepID=UPI002007E09A|nr:uncharacterized protein F5Y00DRAFT_225503 [Daldinia vernicosa]KAI0853126.1 hypothetical protein F5Y00DRAFT_225503 [Daldinia vernicosa]